MKRILSSVLDVIVVMSLIIIVRRYIHSPLLNLLLFAVYFIVPEYIWHTTPGKMIFNLKIVYEKSDIPIYVQMILRVVMRILCLFPPVGVVNVLFQIWRKSGISLIDETVKSRVLHEYNPYVVYGRIYKIFLTVTVLTAPIVIPIVVMVFLLASASSFEELKKLCIILIS